MKWFDAIEGGPGYRIRKLRYEAVPGLWIPALLYEPEKLSGKAPVMLAVNGHDGKGKAADYKQIRCINLAKRGMIVLNVEWFGMGQLRKPSYQHYRMNQLDLCGTSGVAPFFLAMTRGLDVLLALPNADAERVAVSGLSGGGWQTIFVSSLDPRVTLANPGRRLFRLPRQGPRSLQGSRRFGADSLRPRDGRRLHAPDRPARPPADAVDVQLKGQLLFRGRLRPAAAARMPPDRSSSCTARRRRCARTSTTIPVRTTTRRTIGRRSTA